MNGVLLSRYLYKNRVYYAISIYIYIASYACGAFNGAKQEAFFDWNVSAWGTLLDGVIPMLIISVGGLFFVGSIFSWGGLCIMAYRMGAMLGACVSTSFGAVVTFLFFVGIPVGLIYFVCGVSGSANAIECNVSRLKIRRRGLARPMNNAEIRGYIGRSMLYVGISVIMFVLEYWVFFRAFVNIIN